MWNPCVKKKKKKRPCWEIVTLRGFSSHTSEELATHGAIGLMLGGFFFFFPWAMIAPISVSWAPKRNERHTSTKPPAVTDSHLWANAYTKMNRGREKWRQTGAEAFCFPPRCCDLTWARRRWYICSPAKLASLRLSDSTGIHVVWQGMHKQQEIWG